ncbi:hypothetical protein N9E98_02115 [Candidatus Pelagibacter sp.]|nr:hypothetical protein [Candidatus Pelagibacter sp.]
MKININLKSLYIFLEIAFISIIFSTIAASFEGEFDEDLRWIIASVDECTASSTGVITMTSATSCSFQPDEQKITIYQIDFCTVAPTSPTTSTNIIKNSCTTFFKNDSGSEVSVEYQKSTAIGTESDYSGVPYGTYTHAIIYFSPIFKFKTRVTFASANVRHWGGSAESTCVTKASTGGLLYSHPFTTAIWSSGFGFNRGTIQCGDDLTPAEFSYFINSMNIKTDAIPACQHSVNFIGSSKTILTHVINSSGNLIDGDDCIPEDDSGGIDKILAVIPITIKVDSNTSGFSVEWLNKTGAMLNMDNVFVHTSPFRIDSIDPAPFDILIKAVKKRASRGAWN